MTLKHGDIVVFHYPVNRTETSIKRVIGLAGDRLRIISRVVYRNGVVVNEPYVVLGLSPEVGQTPRQFAWQLG